LINSKEEGRIDKLSDQVGYLIDSIKHGLSDLLDRATEVSTKERQIVEEQLERMRLLLQDERAQWRDAMERERSERRNEYLEIREQINQLMAMMAEQSKGKEHD
jgi:ElaB/YqjD/DUF883 family membrane-anchored ribosome-binding protein